MPENSLEEIRLKKGDSTQIKLKGLATAGYEWKYDLNDSNDCIKIAKDFEPQDQKDKSYGSNSDEVFTVTGKKTGTVTIHFTQQRSWEKNDPVNEKKVKIIVED